MAMINLNMNNDMVNDIKKSILDNRKTLIFIALIVALFYLLTNGYGFFNLNLSYDSLKEFITDDWTIAHKIEIGRIAEIVYIFLLRGKIASPIIVFTLGYIWLTLAIIITIYLFKLENNKWQIIVVSGIMTTNYVISDLAITNPQQLDVNTFALFSSILFAYFWNSKKSSILCIVCAFVCYGIYPSYLSTSILLTLVLTIKNLLNGEKANKAIKNGLIAASYILIAVVIYTILLKALNFVIGIETISSRNGLESLLNSNENIFELLLDTYLYGSYFLINAYSITSKIPYVIINIMIIIITAFMLIKTTIIKNIKAKEKVLIVLICVSLPLCINVVFFATQGQVKSVLTFYAHIMLFILPILFMDLYKNNNRLKYIIIVLSVFVLLNNIQFSNACYAKKDLEDKATLSFLTRVINRMEENDKYIPGVSKVIFVGNSKNVLDEIPGLENLYEINGQEYPIATTGRNKYIAYFDYILVNPIVIADKEPWDLMQNNEKALELDAYPNKNCMDIIDGYFVVRLS